MHYLLRAVCRVAVLLCTATFGCWLRADDWPTFRHDQRRSGVTAESLDAIALDIAWRWQSPMPPAPAWPDSARWDAYAKLDGLRSMRDYDPVFHPVIVGDRVYFASNADDSLRCLNLETGETLWQFTANAPIRVAPTVNGSRVYFGSDDGSVVALDVESGQLVWSRTLEPNSRQFVNDGRLCSDYPVRTGILIDEANNTVVAACGIFPWQKTKLVALDSKTGSDVWEKDLGVGWSLEGAMLLGPEHIVAPQGRSPPQIFAREDGQPRGALSGGGGSFVLMTDDDQLMHGPGNKAGWISSSKTGSREKIASFDGGTAVVVRHDVVYLLTPGAICAINRSSEEMIWKTAVQCPHEIILAGDTLFAGGDDVVAAIAADSGKLLWARAVDGRAIGLAVANAHLIVATDKGQVNAFSVDASKAQPAIPDSLLRRLQTEQTSPQDSLTQKRTTRDPDAAFVPATGPELQFIERGVARIRLTTAKPTTCELELLSELATAEPPSSLTARTEHEWLVSGVDRNELIPFRVKTEGGLLSQIYECDGHFDYTRPHLPAAEPGPALERAMTLVDSLELQSKRGIALVLGAQDDGRFAEALSLTSGYDVIVFEDSVERIEAARLRLLDRGVYGRPVCVLPESALAEVPPGIANLMVIDQQPEGQIPERQIPERQIPERQVIVRCLKPEGRLVTNQDVFAPSEAGSSGLISKVTESVGETALDIWTKQRDEGASAWNHMYGAADNTAFAGETLKNADSIDDLTLTWCGRPGPRYQSDRGNRKSSPLAAGGRLYLQGLQRLIAVDAHNGTILWAHELPEVVRFNVPRDCANWCADERRVYVAMGDRCQLIDGPSGDFHAEYPVWNPTDRDMQWGFIARVDELLIGSCVQADASFTEFWGGESWYDAKDGENAKKVSSDGLFALDAESGILRWNYQGGLVLNPTITIGDAKVVFLECRSSELRAGASRRLDGDPLWSNLFVVALDASTGEKLWEQPARPMPGVSAVYGVIADKKFLLQSSNAGQFAVYAMNTDDGSMLWRGKYDWEADHHGKHLSRPAVLDGRIYLRPLTLDLQSGNVLADKFPVGHQCGTYTASANALFLRAGSLTMWDGKSSAATRWNRVRPDCWISTIPAEGMLLSPEGGGGCSCGGWIETSMGFAPVGER